MKVITDYDSNGKVIKAENEDDVFARHVSTNSKDGTTDAYLVKKGTVGNDAGHLLNVNGLWFNPGDEKAFDKRSGRKKYELSKVTLGCFKHYLKFLETKNTGYLKNAEREIQ